MAAFFVVASWPAYQHLAPGFRDPLWARMLTGFGLLLAASVNIVPRQIRDRVAIAMPLAGVVLCGYYAWLTASNAFHPAYAFALFAMYACASLVYAVALPTEALIRISVWLAYGTVIVVSLTTGPAGMLERWLVIGFMSFVAGLSIIAGIIRVQSRREAREGRIALAAQRDALEAQRALLGTIIDAIPDAIYAKDHDGRCILRNEASLRLRGYDRLGDALGATVLDTYPTDVAERLWAAERRVLDGGELHLDIEEAVPDPDGEVRVKLTSKVPVRDADGRITGYVGISRDVTEAKRAEAELRDARDSAEAATRAKSEFLANMSHEIRTPMNGVVGMTSLLLDTPLDRDQREFVETIRTSSDALLTLINDILDFSKVEAGHLTLDNHPFDVRQCVESALDLVAPNASARGLELTCAIDEGVPGQIVGDETRLRQIVVNLLGNAVKFTRQGGVAVRVHAQPFGAEEGPTRLTIEVEDSGIGIPADKLATIFESFSQADASTTRNYGGTGLGLAICRHLAALMDGHLSVVSTLGTGSTFTFVLDAEIAPGPRQVFLQPDQPALAGRRVLVVDDHPVNREILLRLAQRWQMRVEAVESGPEALARIDDAGEDPFEVVLLDMQMPGMDGLAVARALQAWPDPRRHTVVLTSIYQDGTLRRRLLEAGVREVLYKPTKPALLHDVLARAFGETREMPAAPARPEVPAALPHLRILLAEDNVVNQKVALRMLGRLGLRADVASNGVEALTAVHRQPYDLILMDVQMPEMDGLEATRRIRADLPRDRQPAIIALTANAMQGDRERCLAAGVDDYLAKPVDLTRLAEAIRQVTDRVPAAAPAPPADANGDTAAVAAFRAHLAEQIGETDPAFEREMAASYLESSGGLLLRLRAAVAATDPAEAIQVAHALKSSAASLGFAGAAAAAGQLENDLRAGLRVDLAEAEASIAAAVRGARAIVEVVLGEAECVAAT